MKCKKGYKKSGDKCVKVNYSHKNKGNKFKWTLNKVIITLMIIAFFLFILFMFGAFDKIIEQFFTTSLSSDIPSSSSSFGGGGLG